MGTISADIGREAGYILDKLPVNHRAIINTVTPMGSLESLMNQTFIFALWEEARCSAIFNMDPML